MLDWVGIAHPTSLGAGILASPHSSDAPLPAWQRLATLALLIGLGVKALLFHYDLIRFPYPLDSHEPAQVVLSSAYAAGENPCSLENFPAKFNVYGRTYNAMMGRLCNLGMGCSMNFHRAVVACLILLCLGLHALVLRRLGCGVPESACLLMAGYGCLLLNVTPMSKPDTLGLLLASLGFSIPFLLRYSAVSLLLAAACMAVAVDVKLYFLLSPALLGLWLLLGRRFKLAALFGAAFLIFGGLFFCWLLGKCEIYFYQNYLGRYNTKSFPGYNFAYMLWQLKKVFVTGLPGALFLGLLAFSRWYSGELSPPPGSEWWLYALGGLAAFVLSLGGHMGTRLTFAVHLVVWPLIPALGGLCSAMGRKRGLALACLALNAACAVNMADHGGFSRLSDLAVWTEAKMFLASARHPYAPRDLDSILLAQKKEIYDSGFLEYFSPDSPVPEAERRRFPLLQSMNERYRRYAASQQERVARGEFDFAVGSPYDYSPMPFKFHYRIYRVVLARYPQTGGMTPFFLLTRIKPGPGKP